MPNAGNVRRSGDRREGRLIRTLPAFDRMVPYVIRKGSDARCEFSDSLEITGIEAWLREKRAEGWASLSFSHLLIAAYIRTVSMRPAVNRFISGNRIFARNDILVSTIVKRGPDPEDTRTAVKLRFSPTATVFDVYRSMSEAMDEVKAGTTLSEPERLAARLIAFPRPLLRMYMWLLRVLDRHDWLPQGYLDASPFHASLLLNDMGSLGVPPLQPNNYEFGNLPCALTFGARRRVSGENGSERHFVDYRIACDERIADACYFAGAVKCLKYFMKNPQLLELPPEAVEEDLL